MSLACVGATHTGRRNAIAKKRFAHNDPALYIEDEECLVHHVTQHANGRLTAEVSVVGSLKVGDRRYTWNTVVRVPLHSDDAASKTP